MKKNSEKSIYPNLKILELINDSCIEATDDIEENTLLFEVGGEVFLISNLNKSYKNFKNSNWCFYNYFTSNLVENNKLIVQNTLGNISFFLHSSNNFDANVGIKAFKLYNNDKVVLLVYSVKKIFKNEILICNRKLYKI